MSTIYVVTKTTTYGASSYNPWPETVTLKAFRSLADAEEFESDCWKNKKSSVPGAVTEFLVEEVDFDEAEDLRAGYQARRVMHDYNNGEL